MTIETNLSALVTQTSLLLAEVIAQKQIIDDGVSAIDPLVEQVNAVQSAVAAKATAASSSQTAASSSQTAAASSAAASEAARAAAVVAQNNAVAVVTGGTGSLRAAPGKLPLADATGRIDLSWFSTLYPTLREQIKAASPHCSLIAERMETRIRARYSQSDEQYFARIGVGAALGSYTFEPGEQDALIAFGAHVESARQWGRSERAKLGL